MREVRPGAGKEVEAKSSVAWREFWPGSGAEATEKCGMKRSGDLFQPARFPPLPLARGTVRRSGDVKPKPKAAEPAQRPAFDAWLAGDAGRIEMQVEKYVFSVGADWLPQDNLVSFWRDRGNYPYPLPAERCTYMMFGDDKAQLAGKRTVGSAGLKTLCKSLA